MDIIDLSSSGRKTGALPLYTFNPDALPFPLALYLAEVHGTVLFVLFCFQVWELRRRTVPPASPGFSVDVCVRTSGEDVDLLSRAVRVVLNMHHPHRTLGVDAGPRAEPAI